MAPAWAGRRDEIAAIVSRYPHKRSAIMPLLHLAQSERGYVDFEDIEAVGRILDLTPAQVEAVTSFYALYRRSRRGRFVITVCASLSCVLGGARGLASHLSERLGVKPGETTQDGTFTLEVTGECLAACDQAPVLQVNGYHLHRVTPGKADRVIEALRSGVPLEELVERSRLPSELYGEDAAHAC